MVRSFFEPPDPYTSKVLKISLLEAVQNLTGAVLQFQLKTVLTHFYLKTSFWCDTLHFVYLEFEPFETICERSLPRINCNYLI